MAKITTIIPPQNYELIRDRIAIVLADEIDNQVVLNYDPYIDVTVYCERTKTFDKTEMPCVNVSLANGSYSNKNQGSIDGTYIFNVDVYTNSKSTISQDGDVRSAFNLQRILGICRYVLEDPLYKTLGFSPGFIMTTKVNDFNFAVPENMDTLNHTMARLTFSVTANEKNTLKTPNIIDGYKTTLKIIESEKGYLYVGGNE